MIREALPELSNPDKEPVLLTCVMSFSSKCKVQEKVTKTALSVVEEIGKQQVAENMKGLIF